MNDMSQLIEEERLFEDLCYLSYLRIGFEQVKENKGKPGIDGVTILRAVKISVSSCPKIL
jgi:hypothetical protein